MGKKGVKKTDPVTANFTFTFLEARETGVKAGKKVVIQWKRGEKKENHGHTDEVEVGKDGLAKFNKSCTLKTTIAPDGDKYEPKYLSISLREVRLSSCFHLFALRSILLALSSVLNMRPKRIKYCFSSPSCFCDFIPLCHTFLRILTDHSILCDHYRAKSPSARSSLIWERC